MKQSRWLYVVAALTLCIAGAVVFWTSQFLFVPRLFLAAAAVTTAIGLWMRKDWARQSTIVLWTICMAIAVPIAVFGGFRQFGPAGVIVGLILAIGFPVLIVLYLAQPEIKQAVGAPEAGYSSAKTLGFVMAGLIAMLAVLAFLGYEMLKAVGSGIR